ncbi:MAG: hypothetical protein R6V10_12010 [bacterium]
MMEDKQNKEKRSSISRRGFACSAAAGLGLVAAAPGRKLVVEPVSCHEADYYDSRDKGDD